MSSRYRRNFAASLFLFAVRFSFSLSLFLFAVWFFFLPRVFFFVPWGYSVCREVNAFAVTVVGHRTIKVRQTTSNWIVRILYEATWVVKYSDSCICFHCVQYTARIGPYCNTTPKSLFSERYYSFGVGAPSIWSCAPKIFNSASKISAVHLKIYTWSHRCSQSQK